MLIWVSARRNIFARPVQIPLYRYSVTLSRPPLYTDERVVFAGAGSNTEAATRGLVHVHMCEWDGQCLAVSEEPVFTEPWSADHGSFFPRDMTYVQLELRYRLRASEGNKLPNAITYCRWYIQEPQYAVEHTDE